MRVFFTADLHLGHRLVSGLRGFDSTDDHDDAMIAQWNKQVRPDDQVWVLGDVSCRREPRALEIVASLPGEKHLIIGNHDSCHPMHKGAHKQHRAFLDVFVTIQTAARRSFGQDALLSHHPYTGDHVADRHAQWRLPDRGVPIVHGHTHSEEPLSFTDAGTPQIHVGWDAHRRLLTADEVGVMLTDAMSESVT